MTTTTTPNTSPIDAGPDDVLVQLRLMRQEMAALHSRVEIMAAREARMEQLIADLSPVARLAMDAATEQLDGLEKRGYFAFLREIAEVVDAVISGYSAEDVRQLAENIVAILDTVKSVTQPDLLAIANDVTATLHDSQTQPTGMFGMLKASRDNDVRMGMGVVMGMLKHIGRGAGQASRSPVVQRRREAMTRGRAHKLERMTAPKAPTGAPAPKAAAQKAPLPEESVFVEDAVWSREWALGVAAELGVTEMTDLHWRVVEWARADYQAQGTSPNVRRITKGAEVAVKDVYGLFKKAPGKAIARIAGIPKPGGCI